MASIKADRAAPSLYVEPAEVYGSSGTIKLRIATGGAGQSGLLRALAEAFIEHCVKDGTEPFKIVWLASDTSASFNYLAQNAADVSITYHAIAEWTAMHQGLADRCEYAWRDHWMLVGPKSNPAKISMDSSQTIYSLFTSLFIAAIDTAASPHPVRFLSRYDKSAANILESRLWATIGQVPWAHPYSPWYRRCVDFPFQALRTAAALGEYAIMDRGTWCAIEQEVRDKMDIFAEGWPKASEGDPLLNPAHALVGAYGLNKAMAGRFVDWLVNRKGGQEVIAKFSVNGEILCTVAPEGTNPLHKADDLF